MTKDRPSWGHAGLINPGPLLLAIPEALECGERDQPRMKRELNWWAWHLIRTPAMGLLARGISGMVEFRVFSAFLASVLG